MSESLKVTSITRGFIGGPDGSLVTIKNNGPDTVYYGDAAVSTSSYTGSIASGSETTIAPGVSVISAGKSRLSYSSAKSSALPRIGGRIIPGAGQQALVVKPSGDVSTSTSAGGAINVDNTDSTGAGVVIYSNQGASASGRLLVVRSNNTAFDQVGIYSQYKGVGNGVLIDHQGTGASSVGLTVTSTNPSDTTLGVSGEESGRGTIKVTHTKPAGTTDANASALSIALEDSSTEEQSAAQGIFMDAPTPGTTGKLLNLRNAGTERLVLFPEGHLQLTQQSDPSAPAATKAFLFARDNGGGKTQLCARFPSGAVQVLATEP